MRVPACEVMEVPGIIVPSQLGWMRISVGKIAGRLNEDARSSIVRLSAGDLQFLVTFGHPLTEPVRQWMRRPVKAQAGCWTVVMLPSGRRCALCS